MKRMILLLAVVLTALHTSAQSPVTGFPMYGSFDTQGIASVNLQNLNYHLAIPIVGSTGRKLALNFGLSYDSSIWTIDGGAWTPRTDQSGYQTWGWVNNAVAGRIFYTSSTDHCTGDPHGLNLGATHYHSFAFVSQDGTSHPFAVTFQIAGDCGTTSGTTTGYATDNSGYFLDGTSISVWNAAGIKASNSSLEDTNGNLIVGTPNSTNPSEIDWKDSTGNIALKVTDTGLTPTQFQYLDSSANYQTVSIDYESVSVKTAFGCPGVVEYAGTVSLPLYIHLPNRQKYGISYEPTPGATGFYTGRIAQITLPGGGSMVFTYPGSNDGISCSDASTLGLTVAANGTNSSVKGFARTPSGTNWNTSVTNPQMPYDTAANLTVFTFNSSGQEITRQIYQGSSLPQNLIRTVNTTWAGNGTPSFTTLVLEDGNTQSRTDTTFDVYGNLLSSSEHDWGAGAPGSILRTTTNTLSTNSNYLNRHMLNLIATKTVADGSGTIKSRSDFAYDGNPLNSPCPAGIPGHDDTNYGCSVVYRGNLTATTSYTNAALPSGGIVKNFYYDEFGNLVQSDLDCCQRETSTYSAATQYAFPDTVTRGAPGGTQLTTSQTYNISSGTLKQSVNENLQSTTYSYDEMNRLLSVTHPDGSVVNYTYDDGGHTVTVSTPIAGTAKLQMQTLTDGLGRTIETTALDAANTSYSIIETQYDPLNRPYRVSNPHNSTAQYWTETHFDAVGRPTVTFQSDGSSTTNRTVYAYLTNTLTVTDQAGKARKQVLDGLGRAIKTFEPDTSNGNTLTQETDTTYSVLDAVQTITQGAQTRNYSYDDLGRLLSAKEPETNQVAVTYVYNNFGLLTQKTDARGVITTHGYDGLNRPTTLSYNVGSTGVTPTAGVTLTYDEGGSAAFAFGKLTTLTDGVGTEKYTYNKMEELTGSSKVMSSSTYVTNYTYNLAGEVTSIEYPSGRIVQKYYDAIGRPCAVGAGTSCSDTANYLSNLVYSPAGPATSFRYGNGTLANMTYSPDRLQLTSQSYALGAQSLFAVGIWYKFDATNCPSGITGNNGQIQCVTDGLDAGKNESFSYDAIGRLAAATTSGSTAYPKWGLSFTYDRYGNRTAQTVTAGSAPANSVAVNSATNRIITTGYGYDPNGNTTNDGSNVLTYDARNNLVTSVGGLGSGTYTYDGNGLRVKKTAGSTTTVYAYSGSRVIAEYVNGVAPNSPTREYIYSEGALIAKIEGGVTNYYHSDGLSLRLTTDGTGSSIGEQGHYPFGESWYAHNSTSKWQFTTFERDAESGNDYAMARYGINRLGRFSGPDSFGGSISAPQSLNRYSYVQNDPTNSIDPTGDLIIPGFGYVSVGPGEQGFDGLFDEFFWDNNDETQQTQTGWNETWTPDTGQGAGFNLVGASSSGAGANLGGTLEDDPAYDSFIYQGNGGGTADFFRKFRDVILDIKFKDPICWNFLAGRNAQASEVVRTVPITVGHTSDNPGQLGQTDPTYTGPNLTVPSSSSIVINQKSFFFIKGIRINFGGILMPSGSPQLQLAAVLHEIAHATGALPGEQKSSDESANNAAIVLNCAKTIGSFPPK